MCYIASLQYSCGYADFMQYAVEKQWIRYMKGITFFLNLYFYSFYSSSSCHRFVIFKFLSAMLKIKKKKNENQDSGALKQTPNHRKVSNIAYRVRGRNSHGGRFALCSLPLNLQGLCYTCAVQWSWQALTEIENFSLIFHLQNHIDIIIMNP